MASYFDEHNCEPLAEGQTPDHLLHLARMLQEGGYMEEFEELFGQVNSSPPASKECIANLPDVKVSNHDKMSIRLFCPTVNCCGAEMFVGQIVSRSYSIHHMAEVYLFVL